jgi:hypothetical protein
MSNGHTNFLGIRVDGDIVGTERRKAQRTLAEFEPIVRAVLDDPTIASFGWHQYTPYFNDGEPCVFHTYGFWVRTVDDVAAAAGRGSGDNDAPAGGDVDEDHDDDEGDDERFELWHHPTLGKVTGHWVDDDYVVDSYTGPDRERHDRCRALETAIEGGAFLDVLLNAFGDHAQVTIRRDGISVEFYEHD